MYSRAHERARAFFHVGRNPRSYLLVHLLGGAHFLPPGTEERLSITGVLITNAVASFLLLSLAFFLGTLQTSSLKPVLWFMLAGCLGQGMGHLASYTAIQRIGASRTSPVQASAPIWAVFFAAFFLGEEPGVAVVLGTLSIVVGVALISMGEGKDVAKGGMGPDFRRALMFPVFASFMYAAMPVIAKIGYAEQRTPFAAVGFAFLAGFLFLLVAKPFLGASGRIHVGRRDVCWILLGSVFSLDRHGTFVVHPHVLGRHGRPPPESHRPDMGGALEPRLHGRHGARERAPFRRGGTGRARGISDHEFSVRNPKAEYPQANFSLLHKYQSMNHTSFAR